MDFITIVLSTILTLTMILITTFFSSSRSVTKNLPPGPTPLPLIGNLHLLTKHPHKSLAHLAKTHGPLMLLRLGFKNAVVISSPAVAKEALQKNDLAFSSRSVPHALHTRDHHNHSVVLLPVSPAWRRLRKILNSNIFSGSRMDANQHLRRKKVEELVEYCRKSSLVNEPVDLGRAVFRTSLNLLSNTIFSKDLEDPLFDSGKELKEVIGKVMVEVGKPNLADFYPVFAKLDPQGIQRRIRVYFGKLFEILNVLIDERVEKRKSHGAEMDDQDVIDVLLSINEQSPEQIDRIHIETLCLDLFNAGTDTTSSTLEWAMAEALRNPETVRRVRDELDRVIGKRRVLDEEDVVHLPYLQCMVKETLRLHPPVPLLVPRMVEKDVDVCGYTVPRDSKVFVNVWAIGRDPNTWVDPLEFRPERFLDSEVDVKGRDFELIPFGAGRRICPGLPLVVRVVPVILGSLLYMFDWKLEGGIRPEELDMEERSGITLQRTHPLRAIPVPIERDVIYSVK